MIKIVMKTIIFGLLAVGCGPGPVGEESPKSHISDPVQASPVDFAVPPAPKDSSVLADSEAPPVSRAAPRLSQIRTQVADHIDGKRINVLLGPYFRATAPEFYQLRNFSTSETLDRRIFAMGEIFGPEQNVAGIGGEGCHRDFERAVKVYDGRVFCDATPRVDEYRSSYQRQYPLNHLELVAVHQSRVYERWIVGAFGQWQDSSESAFAAVAVCKGATDQGSRRLRSAPLKRGAHQTSLQWCRFKRDSKEDWWQGVVWIRRSADPQAPRLAVVYGISSLRGVGNLDHFQRRLESMIPDLIHML